VVFFTTRDLWQMGIKQSDLCCLIEYPAGAVVKRDENELVEKVSAISTVF